MEAAPILSGLESVWQSLGHVYLIQDTNQLLAFHSFTEHLSALLSVGYNLSPHAAGALL
jgi:hypothetical protein